MILFYKITMLIKWCVIFIIINVVSCIRSIQKIPPKYNTASPNPDLTKLTLPSDKNPFPDVVYPTSIFDIDNPFYFDTDDNYEVLGPFSEDVKSSYKLLSSFMKSTPKNSVGNVKSQTEINEFVITPATDVVNFVSVQEKVTEDCHNDSQEICVNAKVLEGLIETQNSTDSILDNIAQNIDFYNISLPQEIKNKSSSKIPLLVKINIQVFKDRPNKSTEEKFIEIPDNLSSQGNQDNEENTKHLKQDTDISSNESSEEIKSSSEELYKEMQDIKHSDFIQIISTMLVDLLVSTENSTSDILNLTSIENELLERMGLESVDNLTNLETFCSMESNVTDIKVNGTHSDFENLLNFTDHLNLTDLTVNRTHNDFESMLNSNKPINLTDLTVYQIHNDFENLLNLTDSSNLTDQTVNGTYNYFENMLNLTKALNLKDLAKNGNHNDFENMLNSNEPLNLTDLTVHETHNDFENLFILTDSSNLTEQTVNGTLNDLEKFLNLTNPLNLTDLTVNEAHIDFENLLNLTESLNLTDRTVCEFDNLLNFTKPFSDCDGESNKDSKEDYFLELVISLDSLCDNNKTEEVVANSEYLTNREYLIYKNSTDI